MANRTRDARRRRTVVEGCRSRTGAGYSVRSAGDRRESRQARAAVSRRRLSGRSVASETVLDPATRRADVHALVAPGPRTVLASVAVDGDDGDAAKIAQALSVSPGMPVGASALGAARRRLYETGIYRSVEIELEPVPDSSSVRLQPDPLDQAAGQRPVVARIRVEERPRYSLRYGLAVNSELNAAEERDTRVGFAADFENRNLLGRGLTVGLSARLRRDQEVARVYLGANRFFALPLRSTVFLSRSREDIGSDSASPRGSRTSRKSARSKCTAFAVSWICATATNWAGTTRPPRSSM